MCWYITSCFMYWWIIMSYAINSSNFSLNATCIWVRIIHWHDKKYILYLPIPYLQVSECIFMVVFQTMFLICIIFMLTHLSNSIHRFLYEWWKSWASKECNILNVPVGTGSYLRINFPWVWYGLHGSFILIVTLPWLIILWFQCVIDFIFPRQIFSIGGITFNLWYSCVNNNTTHIYHVWPTSFILLRNR